MGSETSVLLWSTNVGYLTYAPRSIAVSCVGRNVSVVVQAGAIRLAIRRLRHWVFFEDCEKSHQSEHRTTILLSSNVKPERLAAMTRDFSRDLARRCAVDIAFRAGQHRRTR